jgi:hypothetical protein
VISFNTSSVDWYKKVRRSYKNEIDIFLVYSPETERVYQIPVDDVGATSVYLRLAPTKNKQAKRIRWAKDYEI